MKILYTILVFAGFVYIAALAVRNWERYKVERAALRELEAKAYSSEAE